MNRSFAYVLIAALTLLAAGLGFRLWQDQQATEVLKIEIGESGVTIQSH